MSTTEHKISVMQAAVAGRKIQRRRRCISNMDWKAKDNCLWNWEVWEYRIKPEPREFWIHGDSVWDCKPDRCAEGVIHVREVEE